MLKLTKFEMFEEKARRMADGFRAPEIPNTPLHFRDDEMLPMQAAQRFQGILDGFQGVRDAEGAHRLALAELERAMPHHAAFYEEAVEVVKSHFGSDPRRLASFGLEGVKKAHKRHRRERPEREVVRTTVEEEVTIGPGGRPEVEVIDIETEVVEAPEGREGRPRPVRHPRIPRAARAPFVPGVAPAMPAPVSKGTKGSASTKRGAGR